MGFADAVRSDESHQRGPKCAVCKFLDTYDGDPPLDDEARQVINDTDGRFEHAATARKMAEWWGIEVEGQTVARHRRNHVRA